MKLHFVTIGRPHLAYAQLGWDEYIKRLGRFHQVRTSHLADKFANDSAQIKQAIGTAYLVVLEVTGRQLASEELAQFLEQRAQEGREICLVIGGPDGLPPGVISDADYQWSLGKLTLPHDLAMVVTAEAVYRASTINASHPYHRA